MPNVSGKRPGKKKASKQSAHNGVVRGAVRAAPKARGREPEVVEFEERGERRALSHVGGRVEFRGSDETLRPGLERALDVTSDEDVVRAHVHGFHSYPARLHPETARGLIEALSEPGQTVLDPFCGSGTVLVESALAGRRALGVDVNPLSVLLARVKCAKTTTEEREAILDAADQVATSADDRRVERQGPTHQYPPADRAWFDIHVLLELDGLRAAIERIKEPKLRLPLDLAFSSVLTKVSRRAADTARREHQKRIASGFTIRHFVERCEELVERMREFSELCDKTPEVYVFEGDARKLTQVKDHSCHLVVSSPPYPGVFDYLDHHELRLRWLGMKSADFAKTEIGARRQMGALRDLGLARWKSDLTQVLLAMHRVLAKGGRAALVIADSVVGREALYADELLTELAPKCGFEVKEIASQRRPYFHKPTERAFEGRARKEHVVVLEPSASTLTKPKRAPR
ncbi:MAG TPA: DNA methyltransferase [Polyangiaceae bacterium]|jgi:DNA modification methylase|nr:DNA methyltransferase [Polyangiaceae bacterium]